ncbi:winged helix-turn-helix domain-containing protein [Kribbella shirazensis]|uniref:DNA-binding transcriptional ArsR family regulator n=1 Tax=Kribbella shirazensis TaxID=1105143 RepID=A0A7X5VF55_9ACTN|nr:helix-turn-helix domain-containing protein [Kribbella shirazensis]NIK60099.1 DNA-binding transcriptional ArsR family regulator [Kribbella shirazensis]
MSIPHRRLNDPRELNALAHPVRMAIVELLSISGPLTATELADRLDETPANCSWHLRKLAQYGFVEEAEGGKGRQRPWQVPGLGFRWDTEHGTASIEERRAAQALSDVMMGRAMERLREANRRAPKEPEEWREAQTGSEMVAWLTADELKEMNEAVGAVLRRYIERLTDPAQRPPGARLCEFVAWGVPTYFPGVEPT